MCASPTSAVLPVMRAARGLTRRRLLRRQPNTEDGRLQQTAHALTRESAARTEL